MQFDRHEIIEPTDILILEGVGAAQKVVRTAGATTYWLDIEPEIGLRRVLARDGAHIEQQMRQWQIDQDKHFADDQTRENCEFKLTS
jgi:thymidylate kinase